MSSKRAHSGCLVPVGGLRITELNEKAPASIVITLVGNKIDLEQSRQVRREEAEEYARSLGLRYFEVSAK